VTEAESLRAFVVALLEDVGAEVRDDGTLLWLTVPEAVQIGLDLPAQACVTFDADRIGEFDAELVAPGSYLLEKLLGLATRRGRWDAARLPSISDAWIAQSLRAAPGLRKDGPFDVLERTEESLAVFAFRSALTSDEKREAFSLLAASLDGREAWTVSWPLAEEDLVPANLPGFAPDLTPAYRRAGEALQERLAGDRMSFQKASLVALEEEVRRIFRYFDGTVAEVREAAPSGAEDIVRAIEAERDRRLAEAVERFEPHAVATLCSVRVVIVPSARVACRAVDGARIEVRVDALTRVVRGIPDGLKEAGLAPPRVRPPSDTPPRRRRDGPAGARSPRGSKGRSRSVASRRRVP
jgi:hypothetical protein